MLAYARVEDHKAEELDLSEKAKITHLNRELGSKLKGTWAEVLSYLGNAPNKRRGKRKFNRR